MNGIKTEREKAGKTQAQLAAAVGVTQSAVSQWEKGLSFPSTGKLLKIAAVLGCNIADLCVEMAQASA